MTSKLKAWARSLTAALSFAPFSSWSHSVIGNTGIASFSRVINALGGLVTLGLLSRLLSLNDFGQYTLLLAYGAILQIIADFGLYLTLTKLLATSPDRARHYFSETLTLRLLLFLLVFMGGFVLTYFVSSWREVRSTLLLVSLGFLAQSFSQLTIGVFQYYAVIWRAAVGDIIGRLVQLSVLLSFFFITPSLPLAVFAFSSSLLIAALIHYHLLPATVRPKLAFNWSTWRELIVTSWPLGLLLLLNVVYFKIDTLILSFYRTSAEVGYYGLAYRLVESSLFLPAVFGGLLLPRLSAAWKQKPTSFSLYYSQALPLVMWAATGFFLLIIFFAPAFISIIAGQNFAPSVSLLRLLAPALFMMFFGNVIGFGLVAAGKQRTLLWLSLALTLINLVANLIFIPTYGALAAAATTVATEILAASLSLILLWRLCSPKVSFYFLGRLAVLVLVSLLIFIIIPSAWPAAIQILIAVTLYLLLTIIIRPLPLSRLDLLLTKVSI